MGDLKGLGRWYAKMRPMFSEPVPATRRDFVEILGSLDEFWGERDVRHLHHPTAVEEFGDSALVIRDERGRVAAYLFGMIVTAKHRGYVHVVAVREDQRGLGAARRLYEAFTRRVIARGCTSIKAITAPGNSGSIAFHESLGMRSEEIADYGGPGQTRIVFSRDLPVWPTVIDPPIDGLVLRAVTVDDIDALLSFWHAAAEDTARPADRRDAVQALIARDPAALVLALLDGGIIGCVIAGWDGWRAHIYRLAVHPDHRRGGLGRWLLAISEQRLRDHGAIRIDAMVLDGNHLGQALWTAAGYSPQGNWSRWIKPIT